MRIFTALLGALAGVSAEGASLKKVNDWGATGVPATVTMHIYVPDKLAEKPPILVCAHYCGGTAAAVFGQAQGGGLVSAADQYGFIMVFPQAANPDGSGRCWDVGSPKSLKRDGGGDTQAIAQMVSYTVEKYDANRERIYASGTSSGAMMTQALLALYPDVFKAGVEFAGVPAGCWATGASSDGTWSGPCAGGQVTHTPAEWGDIARRMYPGYAGHRPRVQLWHGDADRVIWFQNHLEAIKQWTNVLGLRAEPTSKSTLSYGSHQWTRESWRDSCGYTVLDAWTELKGEHGVPDVNLNAKYTIPFMGLDQEGLVDPHIAQCGGGDSVDGGSVDAGGGDGAGGGGGSGDADAGRPVEREDAGCRGCWVADGGAGGAGGGGGGGGGTPSGGGSGTGAIEGTSGCGSVTGPSGAQRPVDLALVLVGFGAALLAARSRRRRGTREDAGAPTPR